MYLIASLFCFGLVLYLKKTYISAKISYIAYKDSCTELYFLRLHVRFSTKPHQELQGTFPFCPISSFSSTSSTWNLSFFFPRLGNTPQGGARVPFLHNSLSSWVSQAYFAHSILLISAVIHSPKVTGWSEFTVWDTVGKYGALQIICLLSLASPDFN